MTNDEYVGLLKGKLEAGEMTDRQILEGADELKRRGERRESLQDKAPRELLLLAQAIRQMVLAHNAAQITLPCPTDALAAIYAEEPPRVPSLREATEERAARLENPPGRLPATSYGWGEDDEPGRESQLEEEALRQEQQRP